VANLQLPHIDYLRQKDPRLAEALQKVQDAINQMALQTASSPSGPMPTPAQPTSLSVNASGGIFDIAITDNNPANSKLAPDYFLEYSTTSNFAQPTVIHLGPARNHRVNLGNQVLYWRAYAQHGRSSDPSPPVYFGSQVTPTPVAGGGAAAGPAPQASNGSGTAPTSGLRGGSGYGTLPVRAPSIKAPPIA
jgi:hypothetical protein